MRKSLNRRVLHDENNNEAEKEKKSSKWNDMVGVSICFILVFAETRTTKATTTVKLSVLITKKERNSLMICFQVPC